MSDPAAAATHADDGVPAAAAPLVPGPDRALQRRTLAVLASAQTVGGMAVATGMTLATLVAARLSGSGTVGGLAQTASVVGAALVAMPVAQLAARHGRRRSLGAAYGLAAVGAAGAVVATVLGSWVLLVAALVLFGSGAAAGLAARFAATDLSEPGRRARDLSVVVWAATLGSVLGPNLAGLLDEWAVERGVLASPHGVSAAPFALAAALFAAAAVAVTLWLRPDPLAVVSGSAAGPASTTAAAPQNAWRSLGTGLRVIRASSSGRLGLLVVVVGHTTMVALMSMAPVHMDHHGASVRLVGLVISLHVAGMYVLSPLLGWVADAVGPGRVAVLGAVLLLASAVLLVDVPGHGPRLMAGLVVLGVGWSAGIVAGSALVAGAAADGARTVVQGTSDVAMSLGGAAGGVVAGAVVAATSYSGLAVVASVVLVANLAAVLVGVARTGRDGAP